jgi:uncharacterized membrane protein YdjX (TVP38/TMEM64 family)
VTEGSVRIAKVLLVLTVAGVLALAYWLGAFAALSDPKSFGRTLLAMGVGGYVAFVLAYAALQPFGVPGTVFIVAAPLIWPWQTAFALSMVGTLCASVIGFSFARFLARDWVAARIPARFRKYDRALEQDALRTVILLRLIFWMPQVLHSFFGISKVRFWTHFWGSLLGYIPPLFVVSYFGAQVFDADGHMQPGAWKILGGMLTGSLVLMLTVRYYEKRRRLATQRT